MARGFQTRQELEHELHQRIMIFDGGIGTMIQRLRLSEDDYRGEMFKEHPTSLKGNNDLLSVTQPQLIYKIHEEYLLAGADFIETNTFSSNAISQRDYQLYDDVIYQLNYQSASIARKAADDVTQSTGRKRYVAGSIGPTNKTLSLSPSVEDPHYRDITFDELVEAYEGQLAGLLDGMVDVLIVETIFDTANAKAALFAIRKQLERDEYAQHRGIPVFVSGTIVDQSGRLLSGQTTDAFLISVQHARPMCIGLNCSLGAQHIRPYLNQLSRSTDCYVICYPNAGMPNTFGEYDEKPHETASYLSEMSKEGMLNIVGGCCGTTPLHIRAIKEMMEDIKPRSKPKQPIYQGLTQLSGMDAMKFNKTTSNFVNIGERCNMAGCKDFASYVRNNQMDEAVNMAKSQVEAGAQILDINFDDGMLDGVSLMRNFVNNISTDPQIASIPFCIDSSNFDVIIAALKCTQGKCIVNSISLKDGEEKFIEKAKIIQQYGAAVIVMAFDESGQATECDEKVRICRRSYDVLVNRLNFDPCDVIFDLNILTIGTGMTEHNNYAVEYIRACVQMRRIYPNCRIVGGVSNLSFAFRGMNWIRACLHSAFLFHAIKAGMDMGIVNAGNLPLYDVIPADMLRHCENLIWNRDSNATDALLRIAQNQLNDEEEGGGGERKEEDWRSAPPQDRLRHSLIKGVDKYVVADTEECRTHYSDEMQIIEGPLMSAMNVVGDLFSSGKMFLPQVIKSARVMKKSVSHLIPFIERNKSLRHDDVISRYTGTVVLATVKGDVHDIGKNIVSVVLACNNFRVIDLGVMTPCDVIIQRAIDEKADLIGLSGLITPSLDEMIVVAKEMKHRGMKIPLLIGGATTSKTHTAVKIIPHYQPTLHVVDASKSVVVCSALLDPKSRDELISDVIDEYDVIRREHAASMRARTLVTMEEARKLKLGYDWASRVRVAPTFLGARVFTDYDLEEIIPFIDWKPFFDVWQLRGKYPNRGYPKIFNDKTVGDEAKRLFTDAERLLRHVVDNHLVEMRAIVSFHPATSRADDVILYDVTAGQHQVAVLHGLRQQQKKIRAQGDASAYLCLSDYVAPEDSSSGDHIGMFVATCVGSEELSRSYEQDDDDDYRSILMKALADRLVEAFAEALHQKVRTEFWPYAEDEDLKADDLFKMKYQGIRPAPGYPTQPDHSEKLTMWRLLNVEQEIGVELTDTFAMKPAPSVCGLYFAHPSAQYFAVGKINKEQVVDYSKRKMKSIQEMEKMLAPILSYTP